MCCCEFVTLIIMAEFWQAISPLPTFLVKIYCELHRFAIHCCLPQCILPFRDAFYLLHACLQVQLSICVFAVEQCCSLQHRY